MNHSRRIIQRLHDMQVNRSIVADSGHLPNSAKYRPQDSAKIDSPDKKNDK